MRHSSPISHISNIFRLQIPGSLLMILVLGLILTPSLPVIAANSDQPPPQVSAPAALLMDITTGKVLFAQNPDKRMAPASTTKILTALIALEKGQLHDQITIGPNPPRVKGTRVYLVEGEQISLEELLFGMLLNSGNDAALAIAEHFGGSKQGFAQLMNQKAAELGAKNSNFVNPEGLSDPNHYTTPRDLAIIARAAMQKTTFCKIVATKTRQWHSQTWDSTLINQNKLLWRYEDANGIKTGYTAEAGNTLVASATRQGQSLIAVVLNEPTGRTAEQDVTAMFEYGFKAFHCFKLTEKGQIMAVIKGNDEQEVELVAEKSLAVVRKNDTASIPIGELRLFPLSGAVPAGTLVGEVVFRHQNEEVGTIGVLNRQPLPARPLSLGDWWLRLSLVLAVFWLLNRVRQRQRTLKNRRLYRDRRAGSLSR